MKSKFFTPSINSSTTAWVLILSSLALLETHGLLPMSPLRSASSTHSSVTKHYVATTTTPPSVSTDMDDEFEQQDDTATVIVNAIASSAATSSADSTNYNNNIVIDDELETIDFPPPLSTLDRMKRAATFWSTAIPIVANYYGLIGNIKLQELLGTKMTERDVEKLWDEKHADGAKKLADIITELKGFYVKTAQIISTRQDLFPVQYTDALSGFTDNLDPMPASLAKAIVKAELLNRDETFSNVFAEFDDEPLGAASIAQVHRAVLTEEYGGREVAVKIQRPSIESKLLGDIANLKAVSKTFQNVDALPLDYYTVFCELEKQLADEFDFVAEAVAMDRIYNALTRSMDGSESTEPPLVLPRPIPGLVSKRVLVMDYLKGVPLSRAREEMAKRGIDPDSPESKLFGRKLLKALTYGFGRTILETGFFHADPHPGNVFVLENGDIGLIDFGQVKQISGRNRETLCKVMIALADREGDERPEDLEKIGNLALELGVELNEDAKDEAPAAVAMWLFDGSTEVLPGGYDLGELSPNSPVKELKSFPQDLVLVGRSSILIKGISARLGIPWSLAREWAPIAREVLESKTGKALSAGSSADKRVRFHAVVGTLKQWAKGRASGLGRRLPSPLRTRVANLLLKREERKTRRALTRHSTVKK
ncbi:ABC1 family-domain containing protein [Nitzschia inconspicua]|uniref:ABC1 family-domain containing protein n=1 Tax=Nitzschia inconspicua TaxID=303405 RepID=A0A9K3LUD2_9STRA|nr:ABC1 family-domain containing protein [Nitzschia inconspicua]